LSHLNDPVHRADLSLIWRRPHWLPADGKNPAGVDPRMRWRPVLTFLKTVGEVARSRAAATPGKWVDEGHDYRNALPALLRSAYSFDDVSDDELARVSEQVRRSEMWIMSQDWS
jgi:uncharacterized membrane protein